MAGWREVAAKALAAQAGEAGTDTSPAPVIDRYGLDADLYRNLSRLSSLPPPAKIEKADNWREVVQDAQRLARDGWAASALALGWTVGDLFGVGARDSWDFEGLAVWLAGRSVTLLDERLCVAGDGINRGVFVRNGPQHGVQPSVVPVMLWEFGR
ncbi:hypothetical protein [Sphingomonas sp. PAMC 26617]|uniref:hypothetical protein n=1 Tax=Sphingomonas sp. PAMC 26617 TaxID=1112216 RepID=UPI000289A645|nr:hypothetical protein [Sphingomonas sp. PAMC 26617]